MTEGLISVPWFQRPATTSPEMESLCLDLNQALGAILASDSDQELVKKFVASYRFRSAYPWCRESSDGLHGALTKSLRVDFSPGLFHQSLPADQARGGYYLPNELAEGVILDQSVRTALASSFVLNLSQTEDQQTLTSVGHTLYYYEDCREMGFVDRLDYVRTCLEGYVSRAGRVDSDPW